VGIQELNHELGNIDLFLLDQILKGRFENAGRILDAGCGEGRNLTYFIKNGYEVWGIDNNSIALKMLRMAGRSLHKSFDPEKFIEGEITEIPFPPQSFDAIICLAVLHFSSSEAAFFTALDEMMKVLRKDGSLFISMYSNFGMVKEAAHQEDIHDKESNGRYLLLTEFLYNTLLHRYVLREIEPVKTVFTQNVYPITYLTLKKER
jgi:SAM-dependent methyltransferase